MIGDDTYMWSSFREAGPGDIRADMREEYDHAVAAGVDPMSLYRGHLLRARMLKEIIDKEAKP